jgi:indole-3-glycerol phosphate synthase
VSRFSEAISEGDGISVIPVLEGDVEALAALAEAAGAEAVAVHAGDVERARARTGLPILAREGDPEAVAGAGGDAVVARYESGTEDDHRVAQLYDVAYELGLDFVVEVREEDELEEVLQHVDPEILLISERGLNEDEEHLELTLDLLADVPAGKLVVSEAQIVAHDQVLALERAGVDAILVQGLARDPDFGAALEELVRGPEAGL